MAKCVTPELTLGFLAACVPALPAFLKHIRRSTPFLKARRLWTSSPESETRTQRSSTRGTGTFGSAGRRIRKEVHVEFESREVGGSESPVESRVQSWCGEKGGEECGGGGGAAGGVQGARLGRVMQWM
ncbi:hypothetical protein IQ07DRAFT_183232 [Pyrenochaeta sp. DS3sAY3a]|nr:hypothetical protein IQ07DRAFT_183232 [Pyrenochaeta sp. DS3sAY3a]